MTRNYFFIITCIIIINSYMTQLNTHIEYIKKYIVSVIWTLMYFNYVFIVLKTGLLLQYIQYTKLICINE